MGKKKKSSLKASKKNTLKEPSLHPTVFEKINYFLILLAIFIVPIIFDNFTFDPFDLIKNVVFRIIVSLMIFFFALDFLIKKRAEFNFHPATYFMIAFVIWAAFATFDSVVFWTSFWGKYRRFEGLLAFLTYLAFLIISVDVFSRDKRRIEGAVKVALITGSIISIYGIMQYLGYDFLKWGSLPFEARRSFSTLGNPALLAGYLVTVFPLAFGYTIFSERTSDIVIGVISTLLTFTCLVTAFNRTSWLAAALAIISMAMIIWFLSKKKAIEPWVIRNMLIIVATLVVMFLLLAIHSQLQKTPLTVVKRIEQMTEVGGSFAHRIEIWKSGLRMINAEPFNGLGPDTFRATSRMFQGERYGHIAPDIVADNAHNYEIQIAAGTGMPGFLFFAAFLIYVFFEGLRILYKKTFSANEIHFYSTWELASLGVNLGILVSFLAYFFQMITSVSVIGSTIMWWFAFAAILSQGEKLRNISISLSDFAGSFLVAISSLIIILMAYFNIRLMIADSYYLQSKAYTGYPMFLSVQEEIIKKAMNYNPWLWDIPAEMARSYFTAYRNTNNKEYLEKALNYAILAEELDKYEADVKALLVQIYLDRSSYDPTSLVEAEVLAQKMTEMMPHHYVSWMLLGEVYYLKADYVQAIRMFEEAIRNNPRCAEAYYFTSLSYRRLGDTEKEARFLEKARSINPDIGKN